MKTNGKNIVILFTILVFSIGTGYAQCRVSANYVPFQFSSDGGTIEKNFISSTRDCEEGPYARSYTKPDWVTDINIDFFNSSIEITCAKNETGTNLQATIFIEVYDDNAGDLGSLDIRITQSTELLYSWYNDFDGDGKGAGSEVINNSGTAPIGTGGYRMVSNNNDNCPNDWGSKPDGCPDIAACNPDLSTLEGDWYFGFLKETMTRNFIPNDIGCDDPLVYFTNEDDFPDWLSGSIGMGGSMTVSVADNISNSDEDRYFTIQVLFTDLGAREKTVSVTVVQSPGFNYIWYPDSDGDTFGDHDAEATFTTTNQRPFSGAVNNNLDLCPNFYSLQNNGCDEIPEYRNWVRSKTFSPSGRLRTSSKTYFDALGKVEQSQSLDIKTDKIWASQTIYDNQGRPALQTLSAPINDTSEFKYNTSFFRKTNGSPYGWGDIENNMSAPPEVGETSNTLGWYYSDQNTSEPYQDETDHPFTATRFSTLNPGQPIETIGGNKINGEWPQAYTFTMRASQELSQNEAFGNTKYNNYRILKTVNRDVHGVENVFFTDTDGKTLAAARSGEGTFKAMSIAINEQGYVDIHVPQGSNMGFTINTNGNAVTTYNLITEETASPSVGLANGFYRVSVNNIDIYNPSTPVTVNYKVNYYDYSLNEYDEVGRLTDSYQPLDKLHSTYEYNSLGQVTKTNSPDEGTAELKYRNDGQIRYSQNSKQLAAGEFSYTNYDSYGRPIESGIVQSTAFATADPDGTIVSGTKSQVQITEYDFTDKTYDLGTRQAAFATQNFVAGNVAYTKNEHSQTWYNYDIDGNVIWMVQDIVGLGTKTIEYFYNYTNGLVRLVRYQSKVPEEHFVHSYSYNELNQLTSSETEPWDGDNIIQAEYEYFENGALKRLNLGEGAQHIDYVYNLAGQLKSINHPEIAKGALHGTQNNQDLFGMQLDYHDNDFTRGSATNITAPTYGTDQLNGNIKGVRWGNGINGETNTYAYTYDRNNWLTSADFGADGIAQSTQALPLELVSEVVENNGSAVFENPTSITIKPNSHFKAGSTVSLAIKNNSSEAGGAYDVSNITYDANGNIETLIRNKGTSGSGSGMDNLTYNYESGTNQLRNVDDAVTVATDADDIKDQNSNNYNYNSIGQLIHNTAEDVDYYYNASGLVTQVDKNSKTAVKFYYNDRNHRVRKETYNDKGDILYNTYYVRDVSGKVMAIYSDTAGSMVLTEQPMYGLDRIGVAYTRSDAVGNRSYTYEIKDHLGNVRAVFSKGSSNTTDNYTDYYPFGMPMPEKNIVGDYRYGFQGQEIDPETGKEAFQLRLWDSRIGRWLTTDPYRQHASPYLGMGNNPIYLTDPDGGMTEGCCDGDGWYSETTNQLDAVTVVASGSNSWNSEGIYWTTTFKGNLNDWNILNNTNFTNSRNAFNWYKQQEWNAISQQHKAEFYAAKYAYGKGVLTIIGVAIAPLAIIEGGAGLTINTLREGLVNGTANLTGQLVSNGFDFNQVDYFDVSVSATLGGRGSILLQSAINGRPSEGGLQLNSAQGFVNDFAAKTLIQGIHSNVKIPTNTWLGDRAIFGVGDYLSKSAVTSGVIGASSQLSN